MKTVRVLLPTLMVVVAAVGLSAPAMAAQRCAGTRVDGGNLAFVASSLRTYRADAKRTLRCGNARRVARAYFHAFTPSQCAGRGTHTCKIAVRGLGGWSCYLLKNAPLSKRPVVTQCEANAGWTVRWHSTVVGTH
jgi:hypothetical protein